MEELSPELVLVSSDEDAQRAREQLPEPSPRAEAAAAEVPVPSREDADEAPKRRRGRRGATVAVIVLAAVGAVGYLAETRAHVERPTLASAKSVPQAGSSTVSQLQLPATVAGVPRAQTRVSATHARVTTIETASPTVTTHAHTTVTRSTPKSQSPAAPRGFVPARAWAWVPKNGADSYEVTFFLDGRVVLRAHPTEARLVMPRTFRYRAGHYRWTVTVRPASANAKPLVDSDFVLTPTEAAAANRF